MFFLRSSSSLWTKYLPFKIRWNINILWHKRDGHLTQSVCSGDKLWREINKALMKKEWRHQFWPQTVISRWNQWISRVLRSTDGPTSLFFFLFALFSFSCWEGTGGNRIDGWTVHILNEAPSHLLTGYHSSRIFVVRMCCGTNQNSQFISSQITFWPVFFWAGSLVKLIVLVASSSLCVFFLQSFFNLFLTMLPSWNLYAAQYQRKSHFWIYQEQNDMNFIKTKSCEKNMF